MNILETIVGIIAILLLLIFVLFLYCAGVINKKFEGEYDNGKRKSTRSKKINNGSNRK